MPLTHCIECNHQISESAQSCPACSTTAPFGVVCELCRRRLRQSQAMRCWRTIVPKSGGHQDFVHKDCVDRYFTVPADLACPDCGFRLAAIDADISPSTLWSSYNKEVTCPRCGKVNVLGCTGPAGVFCCRAPFYQFQMPPRGLGHGHPEIPNKTGCFVATAAYGSPNPTVSLLQEYRDSVLSKSSVGRAVVRLYYQISPSLARFIEASHRRRFIARVFLSPVVFVVRRQLEPSRKCERSQV